MYGLPVGQKMELRVFKSERSPIITGPKNFLGFLLLEGIESGDKISTLKTPPKVCQHWLSGNCVKGDNCQFIHSWFCGNGISMLAKLDGHKKAISGIALPLGSDKLYSGSRDGIACPMLLRHGTLSHRLNLALMNQSGQVYCMVIANEMLFAGAQDGGILAWKGSPGTENPFHLAGSLRGHSHVVTCLTVGGKMLYSGSMDNTIRVWDVDTLQSVMTLDSHTDAPMSLLCWDQYLLSCSLDRTIKVWVAAEGGNLEVTYTHNEEHGVLVLSGMNDADGQPVLLCACNDNSTRLYELPSFTERGRIFSKREVREIQIGPDGLFFTGDGTGMLSVWKLLAKSSGVAERL
ncbi:hypothetical protein Patl1_00345 [Pistacia atlantica]|uniref:Uncharacterized protein n=1 Tax=Pistacia atlantica TaxID=434234 RepID=A0ACC1C9H7_9ROSI|nr:hypothetical protein Patl1_00345 [Pistacia atlantica]